MTLTNPNPGGWSSGNPLTAAQANSIGSQLPLALDGAGGGSYSPVAVLQIGGSGIRFSGVNHEVVSGGRINVLSGGEIRLASGATFDMGVDADHGIPLNDVPFLSNAAFTRTGGPGSNAAGWRATSTSTPFIYFPIPVPEGNSTIQVKSISIQYHPATGHSALPAVMPSLQFWRQGSGAGAEVQLGATATDAAGSVGAYEAPRILTVTTTQTITTSDSYYMLFQYESGANSLANTLVVRASFVYSRKWVM